MSGLWLMPAAALLVLGPLLIAAAKRLWLLAVAGFCLLLAGSFWYALAADALALKRLDAGYRQLAAGQLLPPALQGLLDDSLAVLRDCSDCRSLDRLRSLYADALIGQRLYLAASAQYGLLLNSVADGEDSERHRLTLRQATALYLHSLSNEGEAGQAEALDRAEASALDALALNPADARTLQLLATLAETRGDYQRALGFLNRAFNEARPGSGVAPIALLASMGRVQKLLHPELAGYRIEVQVAGPDRTPPAGSVLVLRAFVRDGPQIPLAHAQITPQSWPPLLWLGEEQALIEGFDLSTARHKGDSVLLRAELYDSDPTQTPERGTAALLAFGEAELDADLASGSRVRLALKAE